MHATDYTNVLRELPGYHYVAEHGVVVFMSDALCELIGYRPTEIGQIFFDDGERDHCLVQMRCRPESATSGPIYLSKNDGAPLYVDHQARMIQASEIILGTVQPLESDYALREELAVYRKLLNRLKSGVHVLDSPRDGDEEARIVWMNEFEAKLLRIDTSRIPRNAADPVAEPLHPSDLVISEDHAKGEVINSVCAKFSGQRPPTNMRPRQFCERTADGESKQVPVRIKDYFIASNPRDKTAGRPSRIVTSVLPLALPTKLIEFLTEKGARAPVLEELGIRSFEKHQHDHGHPIQFRFLSELFRQENRPNHSEWLQLQVRKGIAVSSENLDDDIWDNLIEKGLSDSDIYSIEIADRFNADDNHVIESGKDLEGFEPHPKSQHASPEEQHSEVQFLKIPLFEGGVIVGLSGFYWPIEDSDKIVERLLRILEKEGEDVLDDLPDLFHVIRKNAEKKFVFANRRQAREHGRPQSEFIGKTDNEVFEFDKTLAKNYEKDDERALGGTVVARYEPHRSSASAEVRQVLTIKSPIHGETDKPNGIQCIYWYTDELDELLRETRIIDGVAAPIGASDFKAQLFVSYARKNRDFLVGNPSANPPISGLEVTLRVLENLHQVRCWFDEYRTEDVLHPEIGKQIQVSQIFVLLLSPAFFESRYIREIELPLIQSRKFGDPSVRILPILLQPADYRDSKHQIVTWLRDIPTFNDDQANGKWNRAVDNLIQDGKETEFWRAVSKWIRTLLGDNSE